MKPPARGGARGYPSYRQKIVARIWVVTKLDRLSAGGTLPWTVAVPPRTGRNHAPPPSACRTDYAHRVGPLSHCWLGSSGCGRATTSEVSAHALRPTTIGSPAAAAGRDVPHQSPRHAPASGNPRAKQENRSTWPRRPKRENRCRIRGADSRSRRHGSARRCATRWRSAHGLWIRRHAGTTDSVTLEPGASREVSFTATTAGTYYYAGKTVAGPLLARLDEDTQLNGAIIVIRRRARTPRSACS
jgi:hypothetical protein